MKETRHKMRLDGWEVTEVQHFISDDKDFGFYPKCNGKLLKVLRGKEKSSNLHFKKKPFKLPCGQ